MLYIINNIVVNLSNDLLLINHKKIKCNANSRLAIHFLLVNNSKPVTKIELMNGVWGTVIVSDDSIFKLIQTVRKIFKNAGLPADALESIYGKGYKIKYPVKIEDTNNSMAQNVDVSRGNFRSLLILVLLVATVIAFSFYLNTSTTHAHKVALTDYQKENIQETLVANWQKGLTEINVLLTEGEKQFNNKDLAYLYGKKAQAEFKLQKFDDTIESLNHAIMLNTHTQDLNALGHNHLGLANYYDFHKNHQKQIFHIEKSIALFKQVEDSIQLVDAQMELAWMLQKQGNFETAIDTYQLIITTAKKSKDKKGEMIATNNMASAYNSINQPEKAIKHALNGLDLTLDLGEGQSIANSYSLLSSLYQQNYQSEKALEMITQAIKFQIKTNDFRNLPAKMINLNYSLVQTFQFDSAKLLLASTYKFAESLGSKGGTATINLYEGMNEFRQENWLQAKHLLEQGMERYENTTFAYKKPMTMAYLSLVYYFTNQHSQANLLAMKVIDDKKSNQQAKAIATLAVAHVYDFMENDQQAKIWITETESLLNPKWLFEYHLLLKLKFSIESKTKPAIKSQTQSEITRVVSEMIALERNSSFDPQLLTELIKHVNNHINARSKQTQK